DLITHDFCDATLGLATYVIVVHIEDGSRGFRGGGVRSCTLGMFGFVAGLVGGSDLDFLTVGQRLVQLDGVAAVLVGGGATQLVVVCSASGSEGARRLLAGYDDSGVMLLRWLLVGCGVVRGSRVEA